MSMTVFLAAFGELSAANSVINWTLVTSQEANMAAPHAIHEEFPNDAARIHELKVSDAHFARLLQEYDQVNDQGSGAESRHTPMSDEAEAAAPPARRAEGSDRADAGQGLTGAAGALPPSLRDPRDIWT